MLPLWPRNRSTAMGLLALLLLQTGLFFIVTQPGFFATDDYFHFMLAQERSFLHYVFTPIFGMYPAPGHRLLTFLLQEFFPLNFTVARLLFLALLAGTTLFLGQLVRTLARSDQWWTVALLVPFAFSLSLLSPVWWWSNGLPVLPGLFFTAIALVAWLRSYSHSNRAVWVGVTVVALAAAGGFYIKFLLVPMYLLFIRLVILPSLMDLPPGIRHLWTERARWIAVAIPPAAFLAVFLFSGLADRSVGSGERAFLEYFGAAWFHALVPVSFLNMGIEPAARFSPISWAIVLSSQVLLFGVVSATWKRSALAGRAWALFFVVFALNAAMVGAARLAGFGVDIAYALRYYPEVVFFLPLVLALALRQGAERSPHVAWEKTTLGRTAIGLFALLHLVSFVVWAPRIMSDSEGAQARTWFENLRGDISAATDDDTVPRVVDSDTPEYIMPQWMGPRGSVSTVLAIAGLDAVYNELSEPTYLVLDDGRLAEATFRPISALLSDRAAGEETRIQGEVAAGSAGTCVDGGGSVRYRPESEVSGSRLAIMVLYGQEHRQPAILEAEPLDPERETRRLELRPDERRAELVELGMSRIQSLTLEPSENDTLCIERMELGSLSAGSHVRDS